MIIFTVESILIVLCIPDPSIDGEVSPRPSYRDRENSFRLVHHMNVGYLSSIKTKFDVLDNGMLLICDGLGKDQIFSLSR